MRQPWREAARQLPMQRSVRCQEVAHSGGASCVGSTREAAVCRAGGGCAVSCYAGTCPHGDVLPLLAEDGDAKVDCLEWGVLLRPRKHELQGGARRKTEVGSCAQASALNKAGWRTYQCGWRGRQGAGRCRHAADRKQPEQARRHGHSGQALRWRQLTGRQLGASCAHVVGLDVSHHHILGVALQGTPEGRVPLWVYCAQVHWRPWRGAAGQRHEAAGGEERAWCRCTLDPPPHTQTRTHTNRHTRQPLCGTAPEQAEDLCCVVRVCCEGHLRHRAQHLCHHARRLPLAVLALQNPAGSTGCMGAGRRAGVTTWWKQHRGGPIGSVLVAGARQLETDKQKPAGRPSWHPGNAAQRSRGGATD